MIFFVFALITSAFVACSSSGSDEGDDDKDLAGDVSGSGECHGNVWIQITSYYREPLDIAITTFAPVCDDDVVISVEGDGEIKHVAGDPQAGHNVVYTVVSEGSLKDKSVNCTIHPNGIALTYVRAEVTYDGQLNCDCGYEEYFETNPLEDCR